MLEFIQNFFRRRCLRNNASGQPTGITPLSQLHSAVTFIDVEDTTFDKCKASILSFYRDNDIKGEIFFFDFRKLGDGERLITSITTTVLKKDLNWFGKPQKEKVDLMLNSKPDVFISLLDKTNFSLQYMAVCSKAKFKIGRQQLPGNIFDMVISDPKDRQLSQAESFEAIKEYLNKIQ